MAKAAPDATIDSMFDYIDQCNIMHVCSGEPANYAGIAAVSLADVALTPDTDFTKANGDTNGRKVTIAAKSGVTVDATGTATHVAIARSTDSTLRYVTTCTSQALTAGNTVNIPAWDIEVADPT
jgi:hypothetical protein